jgi:hypothetical protein
VVEEGRGSGIFDDIVEIVSEVWLSRVCCVGGRWVFGALKSRLSWWWVVVAGGDDLGNECVVDHLIGLVRDVGVVGGGGLPGPDAVEYEESYPLSYGD